jgi:uncharacterized protein YecE (DUF72 family)
MLDPFSPMKWFIGTIGFGYDDWRNSFYPNETKPSGYLSYYSRIFNAVEIDSTFHAVPKPEIINRWAEMTPEDFRFCLKLPQHISHSSDLLGNSIKLREFERTARLLGEKLGPILIQFPPSFKVSQIERLGGFLSALPKDLRFAVEIRHQSWYTPETSGEPVLAEMLRQYNICWAATEYPGLPIKIFPTASFAFIRWIGHHGSFAQHTHERLDRSSELGVWKELIASNRSWMKEIYGFFNNDYSGFAPGTANRFKRICALPVTRFEPPQQGRLF